MGRERISSFRVIRGCMRTLSEDASRWRLLGLTSYVTIIP